MDDLFTFLGYLLVPVIAGVFSVYLGIRAFKQNEKSKRRWNLSNETWKLKNVAFKDAIMQLAEMSNIMIYLTELQKDMSESEANDELHFQVMFVFLNEKYFNGQLILPTLKDEENPIPSPEFIRMVLINELDLKHLSMSYDILEPIAQLRLIIDDQSIIDSIYDMRTAMITINELEGANRVSTSECSKILSEKMNVITDKARNELEKTRQGMLPEHP